MDGFRVFLQGRVDIGEALASLDAIRRVEVLDGPVGPVDVVCIRDGVLVELHREHEEPDWDGLAPPDCSPRDFSLLTRFTDTGCGGSRAWTAAHAFLWAVTRRPGVTRALLLGPETEPLYFHEGRIRAVPRSRRSEDA